MEDDDREPTFPFVTPEIPRPELFMYEPEEPGDEDEDEDDEEDDDEDYVGPRELVPVNPWRSMTVKMSDDFIVSFEMRPGEDTREFLDRAAYLVMAMICVAREMSFEEAEPYLRDYMNVEVR
jgi:hypothetical protein